MNIDIQRLEQLADGQSKWKLERQIQLFNHGPFLGDWDSEARRQAVAFAHNLNEETAAEVRILANGKEVYAINRNGRPEPTPGRKHEQTRVE